MNTVAALSEDARSMSSMPSISGIRISTISTGNMNVLDLMVVSLSIKLRYAQKPIEPIRIDPCHVCGIPGKMTPDIEADRLRGDGMNVLESFSLTGKTAIVTGGAGKYGRQIVAALAEAGAVVYVASRNIDALEAVAREHAEKGEKVIAAYLDQGEEKTVVALRDRIIEEQGRVDVLVNNAVARPMKQLWDDDAARFDESMHINGTGLFLMTRAFGEPMIEQRSGSIINISSMMGMVGIEYDNYDGTDMRGGSPDYFFHRGGTINFTRFCASYFGYHDVRVNTISPGGLDTGAAPRRFVEQYSKRTQLGRMANNTDLKGAVVFLASDASAYVTGVNLPVDGGYTAK